MSVRPRPIDCCRVPVPAPVLPVGEWERLVAAFEALSDPTRPEMFRLIAAPESPLCSCDVVERFDLAQPTISHHLKVLRDGGLVTVSRRGIWDYYAVDPRGVALLLAAFADVVPAPLAATG